LEADCRWSETGYLQGFLALPSFRGNRKGNRRGKISLSPLPRLAQRLSTARASRMAGQNETAPAASAESRRGILGAVFANEFNG
jgi:hypothetical protein